MKILITSPINPISKSPYSHRSAQAEIYAQQLYNQMTAERGESPDITINYGNDETDYDQYDLVYVYHGNDWGGTLNLFGGPAGISDKGGLVKLFRLPVDKVISIGIPMPDYPALLRKRLKPGQKFGNVLDDLPESIEHQHVSILGATYEGSNKLVIGDSHAICMYRPGWDVLSIPFKTLHGALNAGMKQLIKDNHLLLGAYDEFEFYFGNIDIRHHLMRQPNPEAAAIDLAERYFNQVSAFQGKKRIYEPLPIEDVSRKLPKTGYYKGTPFFGSWDERNSVRNFFADSLEQLCENSDVEFVRWTDYLKNKDGQLDFKHMEKPRSVHLARASYPYWRGFNTDRPGTDEKLALERFF